MTGFDYSIDREKLPLDDTDDCFKRYYPKCMKSSAGCDNLVNCHNKYSGDNLETRLNESLLRMIEDDIRFWQRALISILFLVPAISLFFYILIRLYGVIRFG